VFTAWKERGYTMKYEMLKLKTNADALISAYIIETCR